MDERQTAVDQIGNTAMGRPLNQINSHSSRQRPPADGYGALKKNILASMILVPLAPFILVLAIGYYYFTVSLENSTMASMRRIVNDHRQMLESFLRERSADLNFIINAYSYEELSHPELLQAVFQNLQLKANAFVDLGIFNATGLHVAYHGPFKLTGISYREADWFKEVLHKGYYISNVFLGYRQIPHFIIAVNKEEQGYSWVIRATIDSQVFDNLVKGVHIGQTGEAYLLDAAGFFQTERRSGGLLMQMDPDRKSYGPVHEGIRTFIQTDSTGKKNLYATTWLKDKSWLLVVRQERADAFQFLQKATYVIIIISLLGGAGIVAIAFYLTGRIVQRIRQADEGQKQLGDQLIRAGRLAEIGEMAAGFAHEINNPLQIIKSEYSLITTILTDMSAKGELKESADMVDLRDSIGQIQIQVDRCAAITQAILKFGRKSEPIKENVDLESFIPQITDIIAKTAQVNGIELRQNISPDLQPVWGDKGHLQQVLLNFFNNAIHAIIARHGSSGGKLVIEAFSAENNQVAIRIGDNGTGIGPENLPKIFTPFFTTKPVGKGTGLGLSVCYGIIKNMGGEIKVTSQENIGTTFTITIPATPVQRKIDKA